jgi:hypothetical protein
MGNDTIAENDDSTSPALIQLAMLVRSSFVTRTAYKPAKVIVKASEVGRIYFENKESLTANELEILFEILREFQIALVHKPNNFHTYVANVILCLEQGDAKITPSHLSALIFSKV